MKVLKFGGTSVGSAKSIKQVVDIIRKTKEERIIVFSAFSGITNMLVELDKKCQQETNADEWLNKIKRRCLDIVEGLFDSRLHKQKAKDFVQFTLHKIEENIQKPYTAQTEKFLLAQGELISSQIIQFYLQEVDVKSTLIPALNFMKIDKNKEPNLLEIRNSLHSILEKDSSDIYITQGFICRNHKGKIDNLQRGGSDYTASLIGYVVNANAIEIWTDIDGMHNNDPRFVENTFSVEEVSFDEAAELAYFGAKILHPQSLLPAKQKGIPVLLKNTFAPTKKGTIIKKNTHTKGVTSIAAKDGITAIKIKSYRMLMAYGFLKKIFEVFETYKTPIDMVTTSEVAVSLTVDSPIHIEAIAKDLHGFGNVEIDKDLSIICVAGDFSQSKEGVSAQVLNALQHIPIRMISYGGSNYNISLLVKTVDKINALNALNNALFKEIKVL